MMVPLSSLNKTYSLLIERESQHTISQTASSSNGFELSAMFTTGNMSNQVSRPKSSYDPNAFCYHCKRTGSCQVTPKDTINIVLLVPDFEFNLLSISQITKDLKCTVCFFPDFVVIQDLSNGQVKEIGREHVGLYLMPNHTSPIQITPQCSSHLAHGSISSSTESQALLWHQKLGHTSSSIIFWLFHLLNALKISTIAPFVPWPSNIDFLSPIVILFPHVLFNYSILMFGGLLTPPHLMAIDFLLL